MVDLVRALKRLPGLDWCWVCDGSTGGRDRSQKGTAGTIAGTPGTDLISVGGPRSLGLSCPSVSGSIVQAAQPVAYGLQHTMLVLHSCSANPAATRAICGVGFSTSHAMDMSSLATGALRINTKVSVTTRTHDTAAGALVTSGINVYGFSYNSGDASPMVYVNGASVGVTSSGSTTITPQATRSLGTKQQVANVNTFGTTYKILHWSRILTPAEVMFATQLLLRGR